MTAVDPNKVHFTGENSFLRLKTEADGRRPPSAPTGAP